MYLGDLAVDDAGVGGPEPEFVHSHGVSEPLRPVRGVRPTESSL